MKFAPHKRWGPSPMKKYATPQSLSFKGITFPVIHQDVGTAKMKKYKEHYKYP